MRFFQRLLNLDVRLFAAPRQAAWSGISEVGITGAAHQVSSAIYGSGTLV